VPEKLRSGWTGFRGQDHGFEAMTRVVGEAETIRRLLLPRLRLLDNGGSAVDNAGGPFAEHFRVGAGPVEVEACHS
jgi:hypothetical protein